MYVEENVVTPDLYNPEVSELLKPLEDAISPHLLPALAGKSAFGDCERAVFALPTHLVGLGIPRPTVTAPIEHSAFCKIFVPIVDLVRQQPNNYYLNVLNVQYRTKAEMRNEKEWLR